METLAAQYTKGGPLAASPDANTMIPVQVNAKGEIIVVGDASSPVPVTSSGAAPVGGGITYTDKTITSATGSSQTIAAANAGRKSLIIKNGQSNTGVNILGGTAAIGGAGTLTLGTLEPMVLEGAACPLGAITVISAAAAYISCLEGT